MAMGARQNTQREWKLLSWWLATQHAGADHIWMQARVGPSVASPGALLTPAQEAMARVRNRWADALFVESGVLNLVEAKMAPDPGVFSQLIHYARLVRADPYFAAWSKLPLHLIALIASDDPSLAMEAPWYGIQWVVYQPPWLAQPQLGNGGNPAFSQDPDLPHDFLARIDLLKIAAG